MAATTTTRPWAYQRRDDRYLGYKLAAPTNIINHVALVLDGSTSMAHLERKTVEVADDWIKRTAKASHDLGQETRVSVYLFGHVVECLIYDMDALRLPSIKSLYKIAGDTSLLDATYQAITDLERVATNFVQVQAGRHGTDRMDYGDHGFLVWVITDGEENASFCASDAQRKLRSLPDGFNVGALVPGTGRRGRGLSADLAIERLVQYGFRRENVTTWETTAQGISDAMDAVHTATVGYMNLRSTGVKTSAGLFTPDTSHLTQRDLSNVPSLGPGQFRMYTLPDPPTGAPVDYTSLNADQKRKHWPEISAFVEAQTGVAYVLGQGYYQLTKPEEVQPQKKVAIYQKKGHKVYVGAEARKVIGLPDHTLKVNPATHPDYDIFVQSTSVNRKLVPGTTLLLLSGTV